MCVCFGDPCAQIFFWIERLFWEFFVLIGSLVELYVGLHSYLCFSLLEKLFWKADSTPPRYLAICRASQAFFLMQSRHLLDTWWIDREISCLLDSSSTPGGSIELLFLTLTLCCSIASSIPQLSKIRSSIPTSTDPSIPLDTWICRDLLATYIRPLCDPKNFHLTPNLFLKDCSSFFKFLLTW